MRREGLGERLELVGADGETRGGAVAAEPLEMVGARVERRVQVECGDRPAGALPAVARAGDQHDRPVEPLHEPGGDDADHALVPVFVPEHVAAAAPLGLRPRLDARDGVALHPVLDRLPLAVQALELPGQPPGLLGVLREQQVERDVRTVQPSGGVDPRREPEGDRRGIDGGRIHARGLHEGAQARTAGAGELTKARCGESAVLVLQRHDVGDRGEPHEVELACQRRVLGTEQRFGELVGDAGAAQLGERVLRRAGGDDEAIGERCRRVGGGR